MDLEFRKFKKNTVKLLFTQDRFMFGTSPQFDLLLLQCETETFHGITIKNSTACKCVPIDLPNKEQVGSQQSSLMDNYGGRDNDSSRSLLDGARAIICDNLTLSLLAW